MLAIKNLKVKTQNKEILHGINLKISPGEIHAIMGPNGSGKSTLAKVLAGHEDPIIISGEVLYENKNLFLMPIEERAARGLFLGLQNPVEIPGVNNLYFLRAALNSIRRQQNKSELDAFDFTNLVKKKLKILDLDESFLNRAVNEGFSGGEKKRNEILQMLILEPKLIILDEIDSGLDIDALKIVAKGVNLLRSKNRSILLITHYQRLLNHIVPDHVHILSNGKIITSGNMKLAEELEKKGYGWLTDSTEN